MRRHRRNARGAFGTQLASAAFLPLLICFLDITTSGQTLGLAAAAISMPFVNPPPKNNGDKRLAVTPVPLFIRNQWRDGLPHDIDTWVRCYSLVQGQRANVLTIGYSRTSEGWLDLLRDDQGAPSYLNEERIQSNSGVSQVPPNTACFVNVHLYHSHGGGIPVEGELVVIQDKDGDNEKLVGDIKYELVVPGQEITVLSAVWDDHGNLFPDSVEKFPAAHTELIATAPH